MNKKSIIISEKCHYEIKKMALERKKKISELVEEIVYQESLKESPCQTSN
jgi:hypothetical protein